jgi:uncharacterized protein
MKRHLIIYAKRPFERRAKTRLGAAIGYEQAAGVYARLLYTLLVNVACADLPNTALELSVATQADIAYFQNAFPEFVVRSQVVGDLGARMAASFSQAFEAGAQSVVLTGSDIPGLSVALIRQAFAALDTAEASGATPGVIGPAEDGGYYLIGMRAPGAPLFEQITWSTSGVLAQTEAAARRQHIALTHLPPLADMDVGEDYDAWRVTLRTACPDPAPC